MAAITSIKTSAVAVGAPILNQTPAVALDAICTLAAPADLTQSWNVFQINWSYSAVPVNGKLVISWTDPVSGAVSETYYITNPGPGMLAFAPRVFPAGSKVIFDLGAGGASVFCSVYVDAVLG